MCLLFQQFASHFGVEPDKNFGIVASKVFASQALTSISRDAVSPSEKISIGDPYS